MEITDIKRPSWKKLTNYPPPHHHNFHATTKQQQQQQQQQQPTMKDFSASQQNQPAFSFCSKRNSKHSNS